MKSLQHRLDKIARQLNRTHEPQSITVFLHEVPPDEPVGCTPCWDGHAVEIRYHANDEKIPLPPGGPHKLIAGPAIEV